MPTISDNYIVVESTPGYEPDDKSFAFDCYAEALNHLWKYNKELFEEYDVEGRPRYEVLPIVDGCFMYYDNLRPASAGRVVKIVKPDEEV